MHYSHSGASLDIFQLWDWLHLKCISNCLGFLPASWSAKQKHQAVAAVLQMSDIIYTFLHLHPEPEPSVKDCKPLRFPSVQKCKNHSSIMLNMSANMLKEWRAAICTLTTFILWVIRVSTAVQDRCLWRMCWDLRQNKPDHVLGRSDWNSFSPPFFFFSFSWFIFFLHTHIQDLLCKTWLWMPVDSVKLLHGWFWILCLASPWLFYRNWMSEIKWTIHSGPCFYFVEMS